ncbi:PQQ-dependent sugar dehydrogenase [Mucilaginibacter myungsuensis]|uniref:PQQ-dependent sugar dehydrogenase n=1 Tax=Mucilaginibacter myungsuensis TaxID=649104 RepID=A0A929KSR4_9SPHI|nr:PQQ-dependent sugar dehydrogenase [Mucilaginibacter myungsuensis]MBE9660849.1 PQQ-dependent sugar dehydrogenase [Mucilaginibacter myungsuensis]MDN3600896.1 PQQ-dependent sugar dehydrogenase [Mucilaginibacter myungsuensis]
MKKALPGIFLLAFIASAFVYNNHIRESQAPEGYIVDTLATDLVVPWQLVFLADNTLIFTERAGRVRIYRDGKLQPKAAFVVSDIPLRNKTGMLGMCIHPDFATNRYIYLAHNYMQDNNRMRSKVIRYKFRNDTLVEPFKIIDGIPANQNHTGCRLVFSPDKKLFITTGDADQPALSQDLKAYNGKILRVNDDGTIPTDNPLFNNDTARKEIWTYGHRNPQGFAFNPATGTIFESEHGPTGGDEINIIRKGENYGWPVIHHWDTKEGMNSPLSEYSPSIGPSEMMFYTANKLPQLQGHLLMGCLRGESILKIKLDGDRIVDQEILFKKTYGRIRSIVTGPDGFIYFSTSMVDPGEGKPRPKDDMILRLRPSGSSNTTVASQKLAASTATSTGSKKQTPAALFQQLCAACHGNKLQGMDGKTHDLTAGMFKYGSDKAAILKNITNGITDKGMPAWAGAISTTDIDGIANYIYQNMRKKVKTK